MSLFDLYRCRRLGLTIFLLLFESKDLFIYCLLGIKGVKVHLFKCERVIVVCDVNECKY